MSLVTQMLVAERYGLRLDIAAIGAVVGMQPRSISNAIYEGRFPIPTYLDMGKRWASYQDVAKYLDDCAERAKEVAGALAGKPIERRT